MSRAREYNFESTKRRHPDWTDDQINAVLDERDEFSNNLNQVGKAAREQHKETGENSGTVDCPFCGKHTAKWVRSGYNGHYRSACEGCFSFME